jgi:hypothetical protein
MGGDMSWEMVVDWLCRHETWHISMFITILWLKRQIIIRDREIDRLWDENEDFNAFMKDLGE